MADLRAYVANCLIGGETFTEVGGGRSVRDTLTLTCEGRTFIVTQREVVINSPGRLTGRFSETTQILVPDVEETAVPTVLEAVDRICWLLAFACQSPVVCYGHNYPAEAPSERKSVVGTTRFFRPVFELTDGAAIRNFIDHAYPAYTQLEKTRKLHVVIDYLLQADREALPTECRLIFVFVLLENLKHTYAESVGIPYVNGRFRTGPGPKDKAISFKAMLTRMFNAVGMTAALDFIVDLRNLIVHSGVSSLSHRTNWETYEQIQDLVREYLLRLLGFKGSFVRYSQVNGERGVIA